MKPSQKLALKYWNREINETQFRYLSHTTKETAPEEVNYELQKLQSVDDAYRYGFCAGLVVLTFIITTLAVLL